MHHNVRLRHACVAEARTTPPLLALSRAPVAHHHPLLFLPRMKIPVAFFPAAIADEALVRFQILAAMPGELAIACILPVLPPALPVPRRPKAAPLGGLPPARAEVVCEVVLRGVVVWRAGEVWCIFAGPQPPNNLNLTLQYCPLQTQHSTALCSSTSQHPYSPRPLISSSPSNFLVLSRVIQGGASSFRTLRHVSHCGHISPCVQSATSHRAFSGV